ncbi:unnamed protein product [Rangifer tarandus platyrhynchus]|uniref:Uncharacterized protein n=1 Tax=Rangifer tarandus platyrhynchus TaxID=3082113 RepID=A0AC59ZXW8_RANTA
MLYLVHCEAPVGIPDQAYSTVLLGLPTGGARGKESACQCRRCKRHSSIPRLGRFPGGGNGNPLQYSCLENATDKGAQWASAHGVAKSRTQLSTHTHTSSFSL